MKEPICGNPDRGPKRGFLLLEALPALFLLAAVLVAGMRLLSARARRQAAFHAAELRESSFLLACAHWESSSGRALVALMEEDGEWRLLDFPDDGWLPRPAFPLQSRAGERQFLWRRRNVTGVDDSPWWEIEFQDPSTGNWIWWGRLIGEGESP
ncbi:MAG: hypothetical protein ACP5I4_06400 [Oceanipulchritudo sp.]